MQPDILTPSTAVERPLDRIEQAAMRKDLVAQIVRQLIERDANATGAASRRDGDADIRGCGTYASRRIDSATLAALHDMASLAPASRPAQLTARSAVRRLEHRLGRAPRAQEVADELAWTLAAFYRCMVEAGAGGLRPGDAPLEAAVARPQSSPGFSSEPLPALVQGFEKLADREQFVLEMSYLRGLDFHDVGLTLGVSESHARRIHDDALLHLLGACSIRAA